MFNNHAIKLGFNFILILYLSACSSPNKGAPSQNTSTSPERAVSAYVTNQACIDIIKNFEGVSLTAYKGPAGHWLIGYGHKLGVSKGMTVTEKKAEQLLIEDLAYAESQVQRLVNVNMNNNQFSALVCLTYNIGSGNFANSTLLKKLNKGYYQQASEEFLKWRMVNGKVSTHQEKRRALERNLFLTKAST